MRLGDHEAGTLNGNAGISIGPEAADVVTLEHTPTSVARIAIADALGRNGGIGYSLEGTLRAAPEDSGERSFDIEHTSGLNPGPGLPGVLRCGAPPRGRPPEPSPLDLGTTTPHTTLQRPPANHTHENQPGSK